MIPLMQACPIWDDSREPDSWKVFEQSFSWDGSPGTQLAVSAESTFDLSLNGVRVPLQQLSDYPAHRSCSVIDAAPFLKPGANSLRVVVHWIGRCFSTGVPGAPYLLLLIASGDRIFLRSDRSWRCADAPAFHQGLLQNVTGQLGLVFSFDARQNDFSWGPARELPADELLPHLEERRVPVLQEAPPQKMTVANAGTLRRDREEETIAATCSRDYFRSELPQDLFLDVPKVLNRRIPLEDGGRELVFRPLSAFPGADGFYLTADAGCEIVGYLLLKLTAPAGTVVDIAFGEHLDDGRVRCHMGGRNFADRYVCREGYNEFLFPHRRIGARYWELHFTHCGTGELRVQYAGPVPVSLPLPREAEFACEDRMLLFARELSRRTLQLCMHEHYEDTPWREQSLYAYDSRNQMLYGYYLWGNCSFAAASLELLGRSFDGERYLALTAPSDGHLTIPVFSMVWITALWENLLFSGSPELFRREQPVVDAILDRALSERADESSGLYFPGDDKKIWNFCEWNGDLGNLHTRLQAPYNLYLAEALDSAAKLHQYIGNSGRSALLAERAACLRQAIRQTLFDSGSARCRAFPEDPGLYEHVNAVALLQLPLSAAEQSAVRRQMVQKEFSPAELSAFKYLIDSLMSGDCDSRKALTARLQETFDVMLRSGATSLWETLRGGDDFNRAGSLSHAWSAVIPYWTGRYLLGVEPMEPGFRSFRVKPFCAGHARAEGEVPVPGGMIRVSWELHGGAVQLSVRHPEECRCTVESYPEYPVGSFREEWE